MLEEMLGAIAGDVIGSVHEHAGTRTREFPLFVAASRFTDDTVLTVATAEALLEGRPYAECYRRWGRRYPDAGYGGFFARWLAEDEAGAYGSFGNGSAMRVPPVGWLVGDEESVLREAERSAAVTHDHPDGVRGAQAIALGVHLGWRGVPRERIADVLGELLGTDLLRPWEQVWSEATWDVTCAGSVPPAISAFLAASDFEDAVRRAVSLGGDADTQAAMTGALAEAWLGEVPPGIRAETEVRLPSPMRAVLERFRAVVA